MDFQRALWNLHRRGVPLVAIKNKADKFVEERALSLEMGLAIVQTIEAERGTRNLTNIAGGEGEDASRISGQLSAEDMQAELDKRVEMMRAGAAGDGASDQARVYDYIIGCLERGEYLRLLVQASAGTGLLGKGLWNVLIRPGQVGF